MILEIKGYSLSFGGRVDKPSVKNFQIIDEKSRKTICSMKYVKLICLLEYRG